MESFCFHDVENHKQSSYCTCMPHVNLSQSIRITTQIWVSNYIIGTVFLQLIPRYHFHRETSGSTVKQCLFTQAIINLACCKLSLLVAKWMVMDLTPTKKSFIINLALTYTKFNFSQKKNLLQGTTYHFFIT